MRIPEAYDLFTEFGFPMSIERLIDEVGEWTLEAPNGTSESIGDALSRSGGTTVHSADEAFDILTGAVSDAYVGRKFYDDRSSNPHRFTHVSF